MADVFSPEHLLAWFQALPSWPIYAMLAISAFVENIFPPIPGDTVTAIGAFLVGTGRLNFLGVYAATTAGSLGGFMALFGIGRILGRRFFIEKDYRLFRAEKLRRAEEWFRRYGYLLVALNRFLPGARSGISLAGGISRLNTGHVACLALISCAIWNLAWMMLGYSLGSNWESVESTLQAVMTRYNTAVGILLLLAAVAALLINRLKSRNKGA